MFGRTDAMKQMVQLRIGGVTLTLPFGLAPMAGMTDTAFRRLVKRQRGCGLVVTEMVSSEGLVRGIDRTLEFAEYTEEERPVSIQVFGGDPAKMAASAQLLESLGVLLGYSARSARWSLPQPSTVYPGLPRSAPVCPGTARVPPPTLAPDPRPTRSRLALALSLPWISSMRTESSYIS